jgi:7-keto-8-aminopelargonate synthetase-like enzyme
VAASREWIDLLTNRARSFIYSTAPPPCLAHAAITSLDLIRSEEGNRLRETLMKNITLLGDSPTPILPLVIGGNEAALAASAELLDNGFLVPAIRFPTVPRGTARLRVSVSAAHPMEAVKALAESLAKDDLA